MPDVMVFQFCSQEQASSPGVFFVYNTSFYFELKTLCVICEYPEDCPDKVLVESNFISPNHLHVKHEKRDAERKHF